MVQVTKAEAKRLTCPLDMEKPSARVTSTLWCHQDAPKRGQNHTGCSDDMHAPRQAADDKPLSRSMCESWAPLFSPHCSWGDAELGASSPPPPSLHQPSGNWEANPDLLPSALQHATGQQAQRWPDPATANQPPGKPKKPFFPSRRWCTHGREAAKVKRGYRSPTQAAKKAAHGSGSGPKGSATSKRAHASAPLRGQPAVQRLLEKKVSHLPEVAVTGMKGAGKNLPFSARRCFKNSGISGMKPGKNRLPTLDFWHLSYIQCQPALPSLRIQVRI